MGIGLVANPNGGVDGAKKKDIPNNGNSADPAPLQLFDIPHSDEMRKKRRRPLGEDDQVYIASCMSKYGDDYGRMFRDIKTNYEQHTEAQLRKLGSRFLLLTSEERLVDVPEKVRSLAMS